MCRFDTRIKQAYVYKKEHFPECFKYNRFPNLEIVKTRRNLNKTYSS